VIGVRVELRLEELVGDIVVLWETAVVGVRLELGLEEAVADTLVL